MLQINLFSIEDIGEKPYRIDRMLTQMRQGSNLGKAKGIILGVFNDCHPDEDDRSLSLMHTLQDRLGDLTIPVFYGFSFIFSMVSMAIVKLVIGIPSRFKPHNLYKGFPFILPHRSLAAISMAQ